MKILEKLKNIGLYLPKLKSLSLIKISVKIDNSTHVDGSTVTINPDKLNGKQKRSLKAIIKSEALDASGLILNEKNAAEVQEVAAALPAIHDAADRFLSLIPPSDIPLLKACLYLRAKFQQGEKVEPLKAQIISVYGTRGGNFANLCSAGYLEK